MSTTDPTTPATVHQIQRKRIGTLQGALLQAKAEHEAAIDRIDKALAEDRKQADREMEAAKNDESREL